MKPLLNRALQVCRTNLRAICLTILSIIAVMTVLTVRLGSIPPQLFVAERYNYHVSTQGFLKLFVEPLYLPLHALEYLVHAVAGHGVAIDRFSSVIFGAMTIGLFAVLIKFWHGTRTAVLATILFACSAWVLHVSRVVSADVLYLWALPVLLVLQLMMHKYGRKPLVFYGSIAVCGLLLYIPGLVWFVLLSLWWQRMAIKAGWRRFSRWWQRTLYVLAGIIWLPGVLIGVIHGHEIMRWLGLPGHFDPMQIGRQLVFVPIHLFVRGPNIPTLWLGHAPLLDVFNLAAALTGIWFYIRHARATRSRLLASYWSLGILLVGLGVVQLSLLVPLTYIFIATGIAYLVHEWLAVFPRNPVARRLGIGLIILAVGASCVYNLSAYFVAWPHDRATLDSFQNQRQY